MINQQNWNRASEYAVRVIRGINVHDERPLYLINIPSDINGAYVFRNCLKEALLFYKIDTAGVRVINIIHSTEMEKRKTLITAKKQDNVE